MPDVAGGLPHPPPQTACQCVCVCWSYGRPDDGNPASPAICDACRMNIHSSDRPRPRPVLVDDEVRGRAAWEAFEASQEEPPFDENHHRHHSRARPTQSCATCLYRGWAEDDDRERRIFLAGFLAAAGDATGHEHHTATTERQRIREYLATLPIHAESDYGKGWNKAIDTIRADLDLS